MRGGRPRFRAAGGLLLVTAVALLPGCGLLGADEPEQAAPALSAGGESAYQQAVEALAPDDDPSGGTLAAFWQQEFAALGGDGAPEAPTAVLPYTGWSVESACGSLRPGDATYCPEDATVAYDENLARLLFQELGEGGPALLLANGYAKHVAAQAGLPTSGGAAELMADCLTGSFLGAGSDEDAGDTQAAATLVYRWGQEQQESSPWFAEDEHGAAYWRARAHLDGALAGASACPAYADWQEGEPREVGAYRWLPSPAVKVGTRTDGTLVGTAGDAAVTVAAVEPVEGGAYAAEAIDGVLASWFGELAPTVAAVEATDPVRMAPGSGSSAVRSFDYTDSDGEPAHGLAYLHVAPDGEAALVTASLSGVEAEVPGSASDPVTVPLYLMVGGLCSPVGDSVTCPAG